MAWEDEERYPSVHQEAIYGLELVPDDGAEELTAVHSERGGPAEGTGPGQDAADSRGGHGGADDNREIQETQETIVNDSPHRLPRGLRIVGSLALAVAVMVALWPSARPKATPAPTGIPIHVAGATLKPSGRMTTLTMLLANDATSSASIDDADIRDADGRRIGTERRWPAGDIAAGSTLAVDIAVPYVCDTHSPQHVPVTLHVSISSPLHPGGLWELIYPVDPWTWQAFEHFQSGVCDSAAQGAVKIGGVSVAGVQREAHSVTLVTEISVKEPLTLDAVFTTNPALRVSSDPQPPLTVPAGGWQALVTTWQVPDCAAMAGRWGDEQALVLAYEGPVGGTSLTVALPGDVVQEVEAVGCGE